MSQVESQMSHLSRQHPDPRLAFLNRFASKTDFTTSIKVADLTNPIACLQPVFADNAQALNFLANPQSPEYRNEWTSIPLTTILETNNIFPPEAREFQRLLWQISLGVGFHPGYIRGTCIARTTGFLDSSFKNRSNNYDAALIAYPYLAALEPDLDLTDAPVLVQIFFQQLFHSTGGNVDIYFTCASETAANECAAKAIAALNAYPTDYQWLSAQTSNRIPFVALAADKDYLFMSGVNVVFIYPTDNNIRLSISRRQSVMRALITADNASQNYQVLQHQGDIAYQQQPDQILYANTSNFSQAQVNTSRTLRVNALYSPQYLNHDLLLPDSEIFLLRQLFERLRTLPHHMTQSQAVEAAANYFVAFIRQPKRFLHTLKAIGPILPYLDATKALACQKFMLPIEWMLQEIEADILIDDSVAILKKAGALNKALTLILKQNRQQIAPFLKALEGIDLRQWDFPWLVENPHNLLHFMLAFLPVRLEEIVD